MNWIEFAVVLNASRLMCNWILNMVFAATLFKRIAFVWMKMFDRRQWEKNKSLPTVCNSNWWNINRTDFSNVLSIKMISFMILQPTPEQKKKILNNKWKTSTLIVLYRETEIESLCSFFVVVKSNKACGCEILTKQNASKYWEIDGHKNPHNNKKNLASFLIVKKVSRWEGERTKNLKQNNSIYSL